MKSRAFQLCLIGILNVALAAVSAAQQYKAVEMYTLVNPSPNASIGLETLAGGVIASRGQVVAASASDGALLFDAPDGTFTLLGPHQVLGTNGLQQVGAIGQHAALWSGTAASVVDLHPSHWSEVEYSSAYGVAGGLQVGNVRKSIDCCGHAVLWNGSSASAIDLNPTNFSLVVTGSTAFATDGVTQVGVAGTWDGVNNSDHAVLWSGSAASAVDLNPSPESDGWPFDSIAYGLFGNQQVGEFSKRGPDAWTHAGLWNGTADSLVDLHPSNLAGIDTSRAMGANGSRQVGFGTTTAGDRRALLWNGTALSAENLHDLLPDHYFESYAYSIDAAGHVYGVGWGSDFQYHALMWAPVPEPEMLVLAVSACLAGAMTRRTKKRRHVEAA